MTGPDFTAVNSTGIEQVIGALLTIVLTIAVGSLIASGILWAWGETHGNYQLATKGKIGVLVALGTAVAAGAGVAWMNWLIGVGNGL